MRGTTRRERERAALRQAILDAARELAREGGWAAVTIRRVAERVEYSPAAIYEYFESKEAIFAALVAEGFEQLHQQLALPAASQQPRERLLQTTGAYWEFALTHQELYRAMFGDHPPDAPQAQLALAPMREALAAFRGEPLAPQRGEPTGLDGDLEILWGLLHGLVSLTLAGRIAGGEARAERLARRAVRTLLDQWGDE